MSKQKKIISMFNNIANSYDKASAVISFGIESIWKTKGCQIAIGYVDDKSKNLEIVDVACGTGAMIEKWQSTLDKNDITDYNIIGIDPASNMLDIAKNKFDNVKFLENEASDMPLKDGSIDIVSLAYGIRNIVNKDGSLQEINRILKKDGILLVLEFFANKDKSPISYLRDFYIQNIMPIIGGAISKDKDSFEYLSSSIEEFESTKEFQERLVSQGFEVVYIRGFSFDVSHCMIIKKAKEIKKTKAGKASKELQELPFYRALKTVTMKCFVKYYKYFSLDSISNKEIVEKIRSDDNYTKESCHSRVSNAKFIIKNGFTKEALEYIIKANRVDDTTKRKARKILKSLQ